MVSVISSLFLVQYGHFPFLSWTNKGGFLLTEKENDTTQRKYLLSIPSLSISFDH